MNQIDDSRKYFVVIPPATASRVSVDFGAVARALRNARWWLLGAAIVVASLAAVYAYFIATPLYQSTALVTIDTVGEQSGGGGVSSQLGGLASLAGINVSGGSNTRSEYIAVLSSRTVAKELIEKDKLMPLLFASRYDAETGRWKNDTSPPESSGVDFFIRDVRTIEEDKKTFLVSVSVRWKDPQMAAVLVHDLLAVANNEIRNRTIAESRQDIAFLGNEAAHTSNTAMIESISRLIEENLNRAMMANVRTSFPFRVIDPPEVSRPESPAYPHRSLTVLGGFFGGLLLAMLVVLWRGRHAIFRASMPPETEY